MPSPDTLTRTGYAFGGWYKNLSDAAAYDFDTPVTESFTLHAKWTPRTDIPYTVKYVDQDTKSALSEKGWDIYETLQNNDAYHALEAVNGLIITGSTGTNVNDVSVLLIKR